MGAMAFLFYWHNLPFTLALATGLVLALIQLLSGAGDGDSAPASEAGAEPELDMQVEADAEHGIGVEGAGSHGPLTALGLGQIPLLIILMVLLSSWGTIGLLANALIATQADPYPGLAFIPVLLLSALAALPLTRLISGAFARLAPRTSTAIHHEDLVGRPGTVVSATVSQTYGRVSVRDRHGSLHTVFAVVERGEPLPAQSEVALLAYDAVRRLFVVRPLRRP